MEDQLLKHILFSRLDDKFNKYKFNEFTTIIEDILNNAEYQKLDYYSQHLNVSRLQHSLNVAYYTYLWSKKLKLDYISATRGAMLHDFFLYDWKEKKQTPKTHAFQHPLAALKNARQHFEINNIMEDCILNHMWPMSYSFPKTPEGQIVQIADKYSATLEVSHQAYKLAKLKTMVLLGSDK